MPHKQLESIINVVNADGRVRVRGVPPSWAAIRMRFMTAAVGTCWRCAWQGRDRESAADAVTRTPTEIVPSMPARCRYAREKMGCASRTRAP